jgi:hypothetical protein
MGLQAAKLGGPLEFSQRTRSEAWYERFLGQSAFARKPPYEKSFQQRNDSKRIAVPSG